MKNKLILIIISLYCSSILPSEYINKLLGNEYVSKIAEYKNEIGIVSSAALSAYLTFKATKKYLGDFPDRISLLNERDELEKKLNSLAIIQQNYGPTVNNYRESLLVNKELQDKILKLQNENAQYMSKANQFEQRYGITSKELDLKKIEIEALKQDIIKLILEKRLLIVKKLLWAKKYAQQLKINTKNQQYNVLQAIYFVNQLGALINDNKILNEKLKQFDLPSQPAGNDPEEEKMQSALNHDKESHCSGSFEVIHKDEAGIELDLREIQEFIDHVINLKTKSLGFEWDHYLLHNFKIIKNKILKIKKQLSYNLQDEINLVNFKKVIEFDKIITEFENNSPWSQGKLVMANLLKDNDLYINKLKANKVHHLKAIVNLVWYFYSLAALKGQDFTQGTFAINYNQELIFKFLDSYEDKYSRTGLVIYGLELPIKFSSHYKEHKNLKQFGLDIPHELRKEIMLPKSMTHILFGLIPDGVLFLKPEDHGIANSKDFLDHSISFVQAQLRKVCGAGDEQNGMQKERVPEDLIQKWHSLFEKYNSVDIDKDQRNKDFKEGKEFGIAKMLGILKNSKIFNFDNQTENQIKAKIEFINYIECKFDNIESRKGNEVILSQNDFNLSRLVEENSN